MNLLILLNSVVFGKCVCNQKRQSRSIQGLPTNRYFPLLLARLDDWDRTAVAGEDPLTVTVVDLEAESGLEAAQIEKLLEASELHGFACRKIDEQDDE